MDEELDEEEGRRGAMFRTTLAHSITAVQGSRRCNSIIGVVVMVGVR